MTLLLQLVGLIGGLVALATFILKVVTEMRESHAAELEKWREGAAHEVLQGIDVNAGVTLLELLEKMKASAFDKGGRKVKRQDLDVDSIRLLLMSMIQRGIVEQVGGDRYILRVDAPNLEYRGYSIFERDPYPAIIDMIRQAPGEWTEIDLRGRLQVPEFKFRRHLSELLKCGLVRFDERGRLHYLHEDDWADGWRSQYGLSPGAGDSRSESAASV